MRRAERPPRAPHRCANCGQIFLDDEALAVHRTHDDCMTADSSDVHRRGSETAVVRRAEGTIPGIPGQFVHPNLSAPRYSLTSHAPAVERPPQNPNHYLGSEENLIDLNRMPSLPSTSNPIDDKTPMRNDLFYSLEASYSLSLDADDPKGKRVLVDLNDLNPYPREFEPLKSPRRDADLVTRDFMPPLSPNLSRERGLRPPDTRNGNSDQAGNLLGLSDRSGPEEATAPVEEDDNPMALDLNLHL